MKKLQIVFGISVCVLVSCQAQKQTECNQSVKFKSLKKRIPAQVCLSGERFEFEDVTITDINNDGLKDFVGEWRPKNLADGDTSYVSIYFQTDIGGYRFLKTFDNLFPIYFKQYNVEYEVKDSLLNELKFRYPGMNPLRGIEFIGDNIIIDFEASVGVRYIFHYQYDPVQNDWFMIKKEINESINNANGNPDLWNLSNRVLEIPDPALPLDEFDYFDYL